MHVRSTNPAAAAAKLLQSCLTLCDPRDGSPPGSPVPGILQARTLEWVAIAFSNAWQWKVKVKSLSRVWLLATPWTAAYQAPPPMGFSRQEYWSGVLLPSLCLLLESSIWVKGTAFSLDFQNRNLQSVSSSPPSTCIQNFFTLISFYSTHSSTSPCTTLIHLSELL